MSTLVELVGSGRKRRLQVPAKGGRRTGQAGLAGRRPNPLLFPEEEGRILEIEEMLSLAALIWCLSRPRHPRYPQIA